MNGPCDGIDIDTSYREPDKQDQSENLMEDFHRH